MRQHKAAWALGLASLSLAVALLAQGVPALDVSPTQLSFIGSPSSERLAPQRLQIRNMGTGELVWRAAASEPWIVLSAERGVGAGVLLVSIDPIGLEPGRYSGEVMIRAERAARSPQSVAVSVTIVSPRQLVTSSLAASPDRVTFAAPAGQTEPLSFTIALDSKGDAPVRWTARADRPWLSVSPAAGSTPAQLRITVTPTNLPPGDHAGSVLIQSSADARTIRVPVALSARASGGPLAFETTALPIATLNLPYSQRVPIRGGRPPYLVRLIEGQLPYDLSLVNDVITGTPRQPGTYAFSIAVQDSSAPPSVAAQVFTLPVIILNPSTALRVQPSSIELAATPPSRAPGAKIKISSGGPPLNWQAVADAPWLKVTPGGGSAPAELNLDVDAAQLAPGVYAAVLTVTMDGAPNSPVRIPVRLVVKK